METQGGARRMAKKSRIPSFVQIMRKRSETNFDFELEIPRGFFSLFGVCLPANVEIRHRNGMKWNVRLKRVYTGIFKFSEGWSQIVAEAGIELGDCVKFNMIGHSTLRMEVYGETHCPRSIWNGIKQEAGKSSEFKRNSNSYFHLYRHELHSDRIVIPKAIYQDQAELLRTMSVRISGHSGKCWEVGLEAVRGEVYMVRNWRAFLHDNAISEGDCLIFHFHKDGNVSVAIYERNGIPYRVIKQAVHGYVGGEQAKSTPQNNCQRSVSRFRYKLTYKPNGECFQRFVISADTLTKMGIKIGENVIIQNNKGEQWTAPVEYGMISGKNQYSVKIGWKNIESWENLAAGDTLVIDVLPGKNFRVSVSEVQG